MLRPSSVSCYNAETSFMETRHSGKDTLFIVYIIFAALYLGVQMFQGLSYRDIGIYMSGSQHFNEEPYAIYYLGQWFLTYGLTNRLCHAFSLNSFMGLRVMHLVFVLCSQVLVYCYLKRHVAPRHIVAGLFLATLAHFGSYTEINYNDYSAGLLTLSIMAFHSGASKDRAWLVCLSGAVAAVAFFFRIVNVTFIVLPFVSWLASLRWTVRMGVRRRFVSFFSGYAVGFLLVMSLVCAFGGEMADVFMATLADIAAIGGDASDPHGVKAVLISIYTLYKGEVAGFSVVLLLAFFMALSCYRLRPAWRPFVMVPLVLLVVVSIYFWESPANITIGLCLFALALLFFTDNVDDSFANLYVLSLCLPMVLPIGSNAGPDFYGKDICFMSLPMAVTLVWRFRVPGRYARAYKSATLAAYIAICLGMVYTNVNRPQMEEGNRLECRFGIDSPVAAHILTNKANADMHNYLIKELRPVVPRGSYMICIFSLPVVSMLDCEMWGVTCTLFTTEKMNERYISVAYAHTRKLPYLLLDKRAVTPADAHVRECLERIRPYKTVWEDDDFILLKDC